MHIELFGTLATRTVFYIVPCLLFLALDLAIPSAAVHIKANGRQAMPHRAIKGGQVPIRMLKYIGVCVGNVLLGVLVQTSIEYIIIHVLRTRSALRIATALPMPLTLAKDLSRAFLIRGPLTYYIHRHLLHDPRTSPMLTKWHGSWQHSLTTALPFSSSYDHSLVYLLHRWLPVYLPALIFRMHMLTYLLFLAIISLEEAFAWSGYNVLPSKIMLAGMARRNEAHLMKSGRGNYGPFGVMDWVHGTTLGGNDVMDDVQREARKRNVRGRARDVADRAGDVIGDLALEDDDDQDANPDADEAHDPDENNDATESVAAASNRAGNATRSRRTGGQRSRS